MEVVRTLSFGQRLHNNALWIQQPFDYMMNGVVRNPLKTTALGIGAFLFFRESTLLATGLKLSTVGLPIIGALKVVGKVIAAVTPADRTDEVFNLLITTAVTHNLSGTEAGIVLIKAMDLAELKKQGYTEEQALAIIRARDYTHLTACDH